MRRIFIFVIAVFLLFLLNTGTLWCHSIPQEPLDKVVLIEFEPQLRAFLIYYDLDADGIFELVTQRQIVAVREKYLVQLFPLYYGYDANGNEEVDVDAEVWIDPEQDGLNGNEVLYSAWLKAKEIEKLIEGLPKSERQD